jgi:hypothetical protein
LGKKHFEECRKSRDIFRHAKRPVETHACAEDQIPTVKFSKQKRMNSSQNGLLYTAGEENKQSNKSESSAELLPET